MNAEVLVRGRGFVSGKEAEKLISEIGLEMDAFKNKSLKVLLGKMEQLESLSYSDEEELKGNMNLYRVYLGELEAGRYLILDRGIGDGYELEMETDLAYILDSLYRRISFNKRHGLVDPQWVGRNVMDIVKGIDKEHRVCQERNAMLSLEVMGNKYYNMFADTDQWEILENANGNIIIINTLVRKEESGYTFYLNQADLKRDLDLDLAEFLDDEE